MKDIWHCFEFGQTHKALKLLIAKVEHMTQEVDDLKASIAKNGELLKTLADRVAGFSAALAAAIAAAEAGDLQALKDLKTQVDADDAAAQAVLDANPAS